MFDRERDVPARRIRATSWSIVESPRPRGRSLRGIGDDGEPGRRGGQALARETPSRGPMLVRRRTADLSPVGRNRSFHVIFISPKGRCKNGRRVAVDGVPSPPVRS